VTAPARPHTRPHTRPTRRPLDPNRLCEDHFDLVARVVRRHRAIHPVTADDLTSAAQLALVSCSRRWSPERGVPFDRYAFRRMDGAVVDEIRRIRYGPTHGDAAEQPATIDHHDEAGSSGDDQSGGDVVAYLGKMTERQRLVVRLRGEGFSTREIADRLGISPRGVRGIAYAAAWRAGMMRPRPHLVSPSDRRMLELCSLGVPIREQAMMTGKSYEGVKKQRLRVLQKLGCPTIQEALTYARETGILAPAHPVDQAA
jgi:RNA polymerase sigma factor (sigma-70 family)